MKIYGNSKSDGFPLLLSLVGGLFVAGGVGLATVGALTLVVGLPAFGLLAAVMIVKLRGWDVMTDARAPGAETVVGQGTAPVRLPNEIPSFPVAGASDTRVTAEPAAWSPSRVTGSGLPSPVDKPKSVVETNTDVA